VTGEEMAARLRLTPRLTKQLKLGHVSDMDARRLLALSPRAGDMSGVAFRGFDLRGEERGIYQVRRDNPDIERGKEKNKWMSQQGKAGRYINTTPGALKPKDLVIVVESPKSTWAIAAWAERTKLKNIKVVDTNGLPGYLVRDSEKESSYPNPDLMLLAGHDVVHCPDSNATRPDLRTHVERFQVHLLESVGVNSLRTVRLVEQFKGIRVNGPDDLVTILDGGDEEFTRLFHAARPAWEEAFPLASDFADLELKADLLIPHLIANRAITILAAPIESYKSIFAMHISRALLTGKPAFEHFRVTAQVSKIIYCVPDMSFELALRYARDIGLDQQGVSFHLRTMKQGELLGMEHPLIKAAAREGAYIVLDTLNYFIDEDNNPQVLNTFATKVRHLIDACGSPGALVLAHPTKAGARGAEIEVTEWVSGTYSKVGVVDAIFCLKKVPLSAEHPSVPFSVYVTREKSRPFLGVRLDAFTIDVTKLDEGRFPVHQKPGAAPPARELFPKKGGHPPDPQKEDKKRWIDDHLKQQQQSGAKPISAAELARRLNSTFNSVHDSKTISVWMKELVQDQRSMAKIAKP
jgi:hypothetical protein